MQLPLGVGFEQLGIDRRRRVLLEDVLGALEGHGQVLEVLACLAASAVQCLDTKQDIVNVAERLNSGRVHGSRDLILLQAS